MLAPGFKIETDLFSFELVSDPTLNGSFRLNSGNSKVVVACPQGVDYASRRLQEWLGRVVVEQLRPFAKAHLRYRTCQLASEHGFTYNRITITSPRTRWGSCSSRKNISLSLYLMLLPSHLIDYVILHELCHTVEMNHGPKFWTLLDKYTHHRALKLREELRAFRFPF